MILTNPMSAKYSKKFRFFPEILLFRNYSKIELQSVDRISDPATNTVIFFLLLQQLLELHQNEKQFVMEFMKHIQQVHKKAVDQRQDYSK